MQIRQGKPNKQAQGQAKHLCSKGLVSDRWRASMGGLLLVFMSVCLPDSARAEGEIRVNNPVLLQTQVGYVDVDWLQERRLGDSVGKSLFREPSFVQDEVLQEFIEQVAQRLQNGAVASGALTAKDSARMAWRWLLFQNPSINAFATPGGYVGINLGLIANTQNPDEVAAVLAHELSHVSQHHWSRQVTEENKKTPLILASLLLGGALASTSPEAGNAIFAAGQGLGVQTSLNFSRDMEREADRIGFNTYLAAGYSAQSFQTFFEKLQSVNRINDQGEFPYLRTHPLTNERIADIESRVRSQASSTVEPTQTLEYAFLVQRAQLLSDTGSDNLQRAQKTPKSPVFAVWNAMQQAKTLYAAALASMLLRDEDAAQNALEALQENSALQTEESQRLLRLLQAEIALAFNHPQEVEEVLSIDASQRPELLLLARAQMMQNKVSLLLVSKLQTLVARDPKDAVVWELLEKVYMLQNKPLRALEAKAQASAAHLDYDAAVGQLLAAQDRLQAKAQQAELNAQDRVQQAIIDSKLKQYLIERQAQREFEASAF